MKKVLLISPNSEKSPAVFPLGLGYLWSSLTKVGFEVGIIDFLHLKWDQKVITNYLNSFEPDIIGISIRNVDNTCMSHSQNFLSEYRQLGLWIKQWNESIPVVLGGSGFSLFPEGWIDLLDPTCGMVGDNLGHITDIFIDLTKNRINFSIPGLVYKKNGTIYKNKPVLEENLNTIPFPERNGYIHPLDTSVNLRQNIQTKRGCRFKCTYCSYPSIEGNEIRYRSANNVVDEIVHIQKTYDIHEFDFVDSVFNFPLIHAIDICKEIIERKIKISWSCFLHPKFVSEKLFILMKNAGCTHVEFGIDSGSNVCLEKLNKEFNQHDIRKAVNYCSKRKIPFNVCLLLGVPGETADTLKETLDLMDELQVDDLFGLVGIRIFPNTKMFIDYFDFKDQNNLFFPEFFLSNETELDTIQKVFNQYKCNHPNWVLM